MIESGKNKGVICVNVELNDREFRLLLDMVYVGNWILNSARGEDRIEEYDYLQQKVFSCCPQAGLKGLTTRYLGLTLPSRAYEEGGIHEAIADYEDAVFFDILAEELSRRDMEREGLTQEDEEELRERMEAYFAEFEQHGIDNITVAGI